MPTHAKASARPQDALSIAEATSGHPSDADALAALRTLRAWLFGSPATASTYDADRLPPGVTRDAFLRRHSVRVRAGVAGWTRVGQGRVVTAEAWAEDVAAETRASSRRRPVPLSVPDDDEIDRALGVRMRRPLQ